MNRARKDDLRRALRPPMPSDGGSAARRLLWAIVGAVVFVAVTRGLDLI